MQIMSCKEYAMYYRRVTGLHISPESVGHMCRTGKLDAFKEPEGKTWFIKVEPAAPIEEYNKLKNDYIALQTTVKNVSKLLGGVI